MLNYRKRTNIDSDVPGQYLKNTKIKLSEIANIEKIMNENDNIKNNQHMKQQYNDNEPQPLNNNIPSNQQISHQPFIFDQQSNIQKQPTNQLFPNQHFTNQHLEQNQQKPQFINQLPFEQKPQYVINIQQSIDKDAIVVGTNYQKKKFIFYDKNKNFLGAFTIYDFIKYVTSNVSSNFLVGTDHESVKPIIEKYICNIKSDEKKINNKFVIHMLNYFESPFVGNIETLIKLYSFIHEFETNELQKMLNDLSIKFPSEAINVQNMFNQLVHTILNHTLKIIAALTNKISSSSCPDKDQRVQDPKTQKIKESLLNYSVGIVYRLSKFIKNEIDTKMNELTIFNQDMLRIEGIRTSINTKLDSIQKSIDKQNTEIDMVFRNVMMYQLINHNNTDKKIQTNNNEPKMSEISLSEPKLSESKLSEPKLSEPVKNVSKPNVKNTSESLSSAGDTSHIFHLNSESVKTNKTFNTEDNSSQKVREILNEINQLRGLSNNNNTNLILDKNEMNNNKMSQSDTQSNHNDGGVEFSPGSDNLFSNGEDTLYSLSGHGPDGGEDLDNINDQDQEESSSRKRIRSNSYLKYLSSTTNPTTSNVYNID